MPAFLDSSMVEHAAVNRGVVGSSPTRGAKCQRVVLRGSPQTSGFAGFFAGKRLCKCKPNTSALETVQIISWEIELRVEVNIELHEWIPDENNQFETSEESFKFAREFTEFRGEYPSGEKCRWESLSYMRERMTRVADKYPDYGKVILVGHGMVFRCLTYIEKASAAEIIECTYLSEGIGRM